MAPKPKAQKRQEDGSSLDIGCDGGWQFVGASTAAASASTPEQSNGQHAPQRQASKAEKSSSANNHGAAVPNGPTSVTTAKAEAAAPSPGKPETPAPTQGKAKSSAPAPGKAKAQASPQGKAKAPAAKPKPPPPAPPSERPNAARTSDQQQDLPDWLSCDPWRHSVGRVMTKAPGKASSKAASKASGKAASKASSKASGKASSKASRKAASKASNKAASKASNKGANAGGGGGNERSGGAKASGAPAGRNSGAGPSAVDTMFANLPFVQPTGAQLGFTGLPTTDIRRTHIAADSATSVMQGMAQAAPAHSLGPPQPKSAAFDVPLSTMPTTHQMPVPPHLVTGLPMEQRRSLINCSPLTADSYMVGAVNASGLPVKAPPRDAYASPTMQALAAAPYSLAGHSGIPVPDRHASMAANGPRADGPCGGAYPSAYMVDMGNTQAPAAVGVPNSLVANAPNSRSCASAGVACAIAAIGGPLAGGCPSASPEMAGNAPAMASAQHMPAVMSQSAQPAAQPVMQPAASGQFRVLQLTNTTGRVDDAALDSRCRECEQQLDQGSHAAKVEGHIDLSWNSITDGGLARLVSFILRRRVTGITCLSVIGNPLFEPMCLVELLENEVCGVPSGRLRELRISASGISCECCWRILEVCARMRPVRPPFRLKILNDDMTPADLRGLGACKGTLWRVVALAEKQGLSIGRFPEDEDVDVQMLTSWPKLPFREVRRPRPVFQ